MFLILKSSDNVSNWYRYLELASADDVTMNIDSLGKKIGTSLVYFLLQRLTFVQRYV